MHAPVIVRHEPKYGTVITVTLVVEVRPVTLFTTQELGLNMSDEDHRHTGVRIVAGAGVEGSAIVVFTGLVCNRWRPLGLDEFKGS